MSTVFVERKGFNLTIYLWLTELVSKLPSIFWPCYPQWWKQVFCLKFFVFRVRGATVNAVSFVVIVDVIVADIFAAIITADVNFFAIAIDVNDIGVAATAISHDCVSPIFVINVTVFDVAVVFAIDVIADNSFDIEIIVIIIFAVVDFTAIIIDFHLLAADDVINVNAVVIVIASFVVNGMIVDIGIVISIYSKTFFLFCCYQRLLLFLILDKSINSFGDSWCYSDFQKITFVP